MPRKHRNLRKRNYRVYIYSGSKNCSNISLFRYIKTATYKVCTPQLEKNVLQKIDRNFQKRDLCVIFFKILVVSFFIHHPLVMV